MNAQKPPSKPFELELVAIDPPADEASRQADAGTPMKSLGITNADPFLEEAAREYQSGKLDRALWARTQGIAGDDESLAVAAYLRARASVLRNERRAADAAKSAAATGGQGAAQQGPATGMRNAQGPAAASRDAQDPTTSKRAAQGPATASRTGPSTRTGVPGARTPPPSNARRPGVTRNVMYIGAAAAGVAFVAVMLWVLAAPKTTESARQAVTAAVKRPNPAAATARPVKPPTDASAPEASQASADPSLADKVKAMKDARNWNVLVLYAAEWTRKEPANATAWRDLSLGYANLRQLDDAFDAASRAVSLAPADGEAWSGLGRVNLALERFPDAGAAFQKALAVRADDREALCGAAAVARREGRMKDADAFARQLGDDSACRGFGDTQSVSVTVRSPSAKR